MKQTLQYGITLIFTIISSISIFSQENLNNSQLTTKDILNIQLPPLDSLFENSKNGPTFSLAETKLLLERNILLKKKKVGKREDLVWRMRKQWGRGLASLSG